MKKIRDELSPETHRRMLAIHEGSAAAAFAALAGENMRRFLSQNRLASLSEAQLAAYLARLWAVVSAAGLPAPLSEEDQGEAGEMSPERASELAQRVFSGLELAHRQGDLETPTRQLLKACLQPEFRQCRDSYKEVVDGACRRQELRRVLTRVSGSHCVDCPYWVALRADQDAALLAKAWVAPSREDLAEHRGVFLPEDFRALRLFLWRLSRHED
jgi:hypothetical protein